MKLEDIMQLVNEHAGLAMECVLQEDENVVANFATRKARKYMEIMDAINPLIINKKENANG